MQPKASIEGETAINRLLENKIFIDVGLKKCLLFIQFTFFVDVSLVLKNI